MRDFRGRIAVITGAGSGMGKQLALQLTAAGAHVSLCDVFQDRLTDTEQECRALAAGATQVSAQLCDVSDEAQVLAFRDAVQEHHATDYIDLLFNNAGISGGYSFIKDPRAIWDKTFSVCWFGVYYCARAFMPLLLQSRDARIVNISSVNAFFAVSPAGPHTAYSAAKAAVKGFSEALYTDLRYNAPHVKVVLVMPGHVGTSIVPNTMRSLGQPHPDSADDAQLGGIRKWLARTGVDVAKLDDAQVRAEARKRVNAFADTAPLSAAGAARIILDGIREDRWRILVGHDAVRLDRIARQDPERLYEPASLESVQKALDEERQRARTEAQTLQCAPELAVKHPAKQGEPETTD
jgi:NAD(P)-dependent dehydrogenase (short-subunit alcohol dehydrogenase family)